jgi:hypothetical protein
MAASESYQQYPLWVRMAVRQGTKRSVAMSIVFSSIVLVGGTLLSAASELGNLGPVALTLGLGGPAVGAACALWSWLALRWVDRNGSWHQTSN